MKLRKKLASLYFFLMIPLILVNITTMANAQDSEDTGKIHGQITLINQPLANQNVSLSKLQNNTSTQIANATTNNNGNYTFENLDVEENYQVSLVFQGVPYNKGVNFENQTSVQIDFTVYNTTKSDANMKIAWIDIVIKLEEGHLKIFENAIYANGGLQVFNNSRLRAWLPSGIDNFETSIGMDCCVQRSDEEVLFDPMDPIKPNSTYSMWMEYNITISSSEQQFEKKLAYDAEFIHLIIENKSGVTVEITAGLENKPWSIEDNNVEYMVFNGMNLQANSTITVVFTGLPMPQFEVPIFLWVIIPLIFGVVFLTYPVIRKKPTEKKTSQDLEEKKLMQLEAIAKLDSEYAAGEISREKYEILKSKHKKKAIEIIQQLEKSEVIQSTPPVTLSPILTELYAEEQALISTLHTLELDLKKRLVSSESYRKMRDKFENRRAEVVKKIKKLEKTRRRGRTATQR